LTGASESDALLDQLC